MKKFVPGLTIFIVSAFPFQPSAQAKQAQNPIIFADVPGMSMVRVGESYYMSSTTMHMSPEVPIMKSKDLVNWKIVNYAYDTLANVDELNFANGKSAYGKGSWASCIRYHNGIYYVSTFAQTTGKTYIYSTKDVEKGPWKSVSFARKFIVMISASSGRPVEAQSVPLTQKTVYLKAECDFTNRKDIPDFFYSLDGKTWTPVGTQLKMAYTIPHFTGYRFVLFNYATKNKGGSADFDFFRIENKITKTN